MSERKRVTIRKDQDDPADPYPWHYTVEWDPREEDAMDYGSLETWELALHCALESLRCEGEFAAERERMVDWHSKPLKA